MPTCTRKSPTDPFRLDALPDLADAFKLTLWAYDQTGGHHRASRDRYATAFEGLRRALGDQPTLCWEGYCLTPDGRIATPASRAIGPLPRPAEDPCH